MYICAQSRDVLFLSEALAVLLLLAEMDTKTYSTLILMRLLRMIRLQSRRVFNLMFPKKSFGQ